MPTVNTEEKATFKPPLMLGDHSEVEPPLPIPNRTVKCLYANDSADTRVKVGNCQANLSKNPQLNKQLGVFYFQKFQSDPTIDSMHARASRLRFIPLFATLLQQLALLNMNLQRALDRR